MISALRSIQSYTSRRLRRKFRLTRSKFRSRQTPVSSLAALQTSLSPLDTLKKLLEHRWTVYDVQYLHLAIIYISALYVMEKPGPLIRLMVALSLFFLLLPPATNQFFLPFLPIAAWLFVFQSSQSIPSTYRPAIWVRVLPSLENILYGANLSKILSINRHVILDLLAWFPYGITHFGAPSVCSALLFAYGPPGTLPVFARTFGYMNMIGVFTQLIFPCSAPWYEENNGFAPADYSMSGSPAGLAAIDKLFGLDLYTSNFSASPLVFGAFPSLHAACAVLEALFMSHVFPKLRPVFIIYALWICWATMYLSHHYAIDLVGGSILAAICFFIADAKFLPRLQRGKTFRWDYDYIEVGGSYDKGTANFNTAYHDFQPISDSEEWTVGSSTAVSSGTRSPSAGTRSSSDESHPLWEKYTE